MLHRQGLISASSEPLDRDRRIIERTHYTTRSVDTATSFYPVSRLAVLVAQRSIHHFHRGLMRDSHLVREHLLDAVLSSDAVGSVDPHCNRIEAWLYQEIGASY